MTASSCSSSRTDGRPRSGDEDDFDSQTDLESLELHERHSLHSRFRACLGVATRLSWCPQQRVEKSDTSVNVLERRALKGSADQTEVVKSYRVVETFSAQTAIT